MCAALKTSQGLPLVLRLWKAPRLLRLGRLFKHYQMVGHSPLLKLLYLFGCFFVMVHWAGCAFYYLAEWEVRGRGRVVWTVAPLAASPAPASCCSRLCFSVRPAMRGLGT